MAAQADTPIGYGRYLAVVRAVTVVVAALLMADVFPGPVAGGIEPHFVPRLVTILFVAYGIAALLFSARFPRFLVAFDMFMLGVCTLATPPAVLGLFLLLAAFMVALRWGISPALVAVAITVLGRALLLSSWVTRWGVPLGWNLLLIGGVLLVGIAGAVSGHWLRRTQEQGKLRERLLGMLQVEKGLAESLRSVLEELARVFECEQALLVFRDAELERIFVWRVRPGDTGPLVPESLPLARADAYLVDTLDADYAWNSVAGPGEGFGCERASELRGRRVELPRLPESSRQELGLRSLLAVVLEFGGQPAGRILLVNGRRRFRRADLARLAELLRYLSLPLENLFHLRHLRTRVIEAERSRISLDLHDGVLQTLLSTEIQLDVVRRKVTAAAPEAAAELRTLLETLRSGREELRRVVTDLRPLGVESADLVDLMRGYAERFRTESGLALDLILDGAPLPLPDRVCREMFQIYREALNNVRKHAGATHVVVKLWQDETRAHLVIDDNGRGFSFAGRFSSDELDRLRLGPISIKERTRGIGGVLTVESNPGHGSRLSVEVPLG